MQSQVPNQIENPDGGMPLISHLDELRVRLLRYMVVLFVILLATYGLRKEILDLIRAPVEGPLQKYSQKAQQKQTKQPGAFADLDDYSCSCSRSATESQRSPVTRADHGVKEVRADFPAAVVPSLTLEEKAAALKENSPSDWGVFIQESFRDFRVFYYSMIGKEQKAAKLLHEGSQPEAVTQQHYPPKEAGILELNCRCTLDRSQAKEGSMVYLGLPELFFAQMKVAIYSAVFLSFPYLLIELWGFIGPALYKDEKFVYWGFGVSTLVFFTGGASFGYFVVFPFGFDFFLSLTQPGEIMPSLSIGNYLDFTIKLFLAFGLIFELPVAVFILSRLGIITPKLMITQARPAMVIILILSAVLTPPDPFTMMLMAAPLAGLYLFSILVCFFGLNKKKAALRAQGINPEEFND